MGHHFIEAEDGVTRFNINPEEIKRNTPREMFDYLIANVFPVLVKYIDDWVAVSQTGPIKVTFVQYEEFITDDSAYFATLGKAIGESNLNITSTYSQHYRKGKTDEWREVLTPKQQELVNSGIPREFLERFGWPSA